MRAPVVSPSLKLMSAVLALLAACALLPALGVAKASAEGSHDGTVAEAMAEGADGGAASVLASALARGELRVSADVALVAEGEVEPVVGSLAIDGLTYAVTGEGEAALVAAGPTTLAGSLAEGAADGSEDGSDDAGAGSAGDPAALAIPGTVEHDGVAYAVTSIGPRALAGCDADVVALPATVASVDDSAFSGSAVAAVEVAPGNPSYSSYDGMLFDADMTSLLLIPEGKQGAARIPKTAEVVPPSAFSHCAGVTAIDVEAGSAAYSSRNGCLYDASGETLVVDLVAMDCAESRALHAELGEGGAFADGGSTLSISLDGGTLKYFHYEKTEPAPEGGSVFSATHTSKDQRLTLAMSFICSFNRLTEDHKSYEPLEAAITDEGWYGPSWRLEVPTKENYVFAGWARTGGTIVPMPGSDQSDPSRVDYHVTGDVLLTARWAKKDIVITWDAAGGGWGSGSGWTQRQTTEQAWTPDAVVSPYDSEPTADAWTFQRWTTVRNSIYDRDEMTNKTPLPLEDVTYYAFYSPTQFEIAYQLDGGSLPDGAKNPETYDCETESFTLVNPVKPGHVFAGWSGTGIKDGTRSMSVEVAKGSYGSRLYRAVWAEDPLVISWDPGGGWWSDGEKGKPGEVVAVQIRWAPGARVVPPASPDADAWEFDCWTTVRNSVYEQHELVTGTYLPLQATTYYARYKLREYEISYDLAGGSLPSGAINPDSYDNETESFTLVNPIRPGYVFAGWSGTGIKEGTQSNAVSIPRGSVGNRSYTAVWAKERITVSWHPNEGFWDGKEENEVMEIAYNWSYGGKIWVPKEEPIKLGYRFAYWTVGRDTFNKVEEGETYLPTDDAIYYARWSKLTYSLAYDLDGGEMLGDGNPVEYDINTPTFTLRNPYKQGCVFLGWALKSDDGWGSAMETTTIEQGSTGHRRYKAVWGPVLSVDVPVEVTLRIDLRRPEMQEEGLGYLESRSAYALDVDSISFQPDACMAGWLGGDTTGMFLEVLPDGVEAAKVRFGFDGPMNESDAGRLASFRLPNGYGSRLDVAYRLDVNGALLDVPNDGWNDVAAGQVSYTVKASS